jgi:hypothetical protein
MHVLGSSTVEANKNKILDKLLTKEIKTRLDPGWFSGAQHSDP